MGTVSLPPVTNLQEDCKDLRNALKGLSCNEKKVVEILGRRTQSQRDEIAKAYQSVFGESLHKRLKSALRGKLEKCILLWMMEPSERDAVLVYEAMRVEGRKGDHALIGIVCTRTVEQLYAIKQAYYTMFNQTLENHIDGTDSHFPDFQNKNKWAFWRGSESKEKQVPKRTLSITKLLLALVRGSRPENTNIDRHIALNDAHQLNKVCTGKDGNEDSLIRIFSTRSSQQLTATLNYYHQHYGHDFEKALSKKDASEFLQALRVVVQCFRQPAKFYAEELSAALGGMQKDDEALIRVIVSRAEVDMQFIKLEFLNECKKALVDVVANDTSGSYRLFLLVLIGHADMCFVSPRTSHGSAASFYSPRSTGSGQPSTGSQNGSTPSASYYSRGSSGQGSFQGSF